MNRVMNSSVNMRCNGCNRPISNCSLKHFANATLWYRFIFVIIGALIQWYSFRPASFRSFQIVDLDILTLFLLLNCLEVFLMDSLLLLAFPTVTSFICSTVYWVFLPLPFLLLSITSVSCISSSDFSSCSLIALLIIFLYFLTQSTFYPVYVPIFAFVTVYLTSF